MQRSLERDFQKPLSEQCAVSHWTLKKIKLQFCSSVFIMPVKKLLCTATHLISSIRWPPISCRWPAKAKGMKCFWQIHATSRLGKVLFVCVDFLAVALTQVTLAQYSAVSVWHYTVIVNKAWWVAFSMEGLFSQWHYTLLPAVMLPRHFLNSFISASVPWGEGMMLSDVLAVVANKGAFNELVPDKWGSCLSYKLSL